MSEEKKLKALEEAYCPNAYCPNTNKIGIGSNCEICGSKGLKMTYVEFTKTMSEKQKLTLLQDKIKKGDAKILVSEANSDEEISSDIKRALTSLAMLESASTLFSRSVSYLSKNTAEQLMGLGFKMLIEQNKVIIRQNELALRRMRKIAELLDKTRG